MSAAPPAGQGRLRRLGRWLLQRRRSAFAIAATVSFVVVVLLGVVYGRRLLEATVDAPHLEVAQEATAQVAAAAVLILTTLLIYATGEYRYIVKTKFDVSGGSTYARGQAITTGQFAALDAASRQNIVHQRGLYFRALYVGDDGRWSTSKLQTLLWSYAIFFTILTLFFADRLGLEFVIDGSSANFANLNFNSDYLLLLGGPFAATVIAGGITAAKVDNGTITKTRKDGDPSNVVSGIQEAVSDDNGNADLVDFQYFFFNLIALSLYLIIFVPGVKSGFPDLPDFVVALTSGSALAYLGKKAVERSTPTIGSVVPKKVLIGGTLKIRGTYLASSTSSAPVVTVDGLAAVARVAVSPRNAGDIGEIEVVLPAGAAAGENRTVSITPSGSTASVETSVSILKPQISRVDPVAWSPGVVVTIEGTGFGSEQGKVLLGPLPAEPNDKQLNIVDWTDDSVRFVPTASSIGAAAAQPLRLAVQPNGDNDAVSTLYYSVSVTGPEITSVVPSAWHPGATLSISGTGFGPLRSENRVVIDGVRLPSLNWRDDHIDVRLPDQFEVTSDSVTVTVKIAGKNSGETIDLVRIESPTKAALDVESITPMTLPRQLQVGQQIVASGQLLPSYGTRASLAGTTLDIPTANSGMLVLALLADRSLPSGATNIPLIIEADGWAPYVTSINIQG